ncbi:CHASE domain-containing protein [Loktanella sp. DJP18]|uniref:CHASE domain-containing protein n=1 Tax=Loktanella sp. DJP18 TaxID=3409788 RepID=UPI003BB51353
MVYKSNLRTRIAIVALCVGVTAVLAFAAQVVADRRAQSAYDSIVEDSRAALITRLDTYLLALDGLGAFLRASESVAATDWADYVDTLDIAQTLPGILGLGLVQPVVGPGLIDVLNAARAAQEPELVIHTETGRPDKMVVRYIAPASTNAAARGLDISYEQARRTAAIAARDTGQPQLTGPISLMQDQYEGPGMLLLRPVYDRQTTPSTVSTRRAAHVGWVYAPFFAGQALTGLTASQGQLFDLKVWDAEDTIYRTGVRTSPARFTRSADLRLFGRTWSLTWTSTALFEQQHRTYAPFLVLLAGLCASFLLWRYLRVQSDHDERIEALVDSKTRALSDRERQNLSVIENSVFGVMHLDEDGKIVALNPAAMQIIGPDSAGLVGHRFSDIVKPDDPTADLSTPWTAAIATDGSLRRLEVQVNAWHRSDGVPLQSVLLRDVTDETRSRVALSQMEERWNMALQGAEIGVFDLDLATKTSVFSETWRRLMDLPPDLETNIEAHFLSRVHPDDVDLIHASYRATIRGCTPRSIAEFRVRFQDGSWRWMRSDAVVVERDADGRALRLVGSQTDISALRTAQQAHIHGEEMLRLVIDRAPVGTAILDVNGHLTRSNAALAHLTGHDEHGLAGCHFSTLLTEDEKSDVLASVADLQGDSGRTYRGEHQIKRADGEIRWGLVKVTWAFDPTQQMEIYIVQINDITQEKQAEVVKGEFIATISHELRTPLTSIKGALGLMALHQPADATGPATRLLDIATANTDRLIRLVNDILDLEKITAGKMVFRIAPHDAAALVSEAVEQNCPLLIKSDLSIRIEDRIPGAQVLVDDARMAQVLGNLLSNACKFAPAHSEIVVDITSDGDLIRFGVTDTGPGVPPAFHDRIFSPFSQADGSDTRQKGGTGLGLNISRQVVERMGGTIGFTSDPDVRTTFYFTCPHHIRPGQSVTAVEDNAQRKMILHLEDDPVFAETIRSGLSDIACVTTAATAAEARLRMTECTYDLILIDRTLRDGEAIGLLEELIVAQPNARIVAVSSPANSSGEAPNGPPVIVSPDALQRIVADLRQQMLKTATT